MRESSFLHILWLMKSGLVKAPDFDESPVMIDMCMYMYNTLMIQYNNFQCGLEKYLHFNYKPIVTN